MQTNSKTLIEELIRITEIASDTVCSFKQLSPIQLNYKASPSDWSILECIEHLNLYGDFYLPEIEKRLIADQAPNPSKVVESGIIGNYFARLMKVENGKITKMKSPKDKNPAGSELSITTIDRFLKQQELLKSLLKQANNVDLTKTKVPISLTKFIKLRLGDTFRFFIYHIERHVLQAEKVKNNLESISS